MPDVDDPTTNLFQVWEKTDDQHYIKYHRMSAAYDTPIRCWVEGQPVVNWNGLS